MKYHVNQIQFDSRPQSTICKVGITDETRVKLSQLLIGHDVTKETRAKLSQLLTGCVVTEETRADKKRSKVGHCERTPEMRERKKHAMMKKWVVSNEPKEKKLV
jgi:hypothetical protein